MSRGLLVNGLSKSKLAHAPQLTKNSIDKTLSSDSPLTRSEVRSLDADTWWEKQRSSVLAGVSEKCCGSPPAQQLQKRLNAPGDDAHWHVVSVLPSTHS